MPLPRPAAARPDPALLAALRARIAALDGWVGAGTARPKVPLGVAAIDAALPWGGLPRGCLHEILAADASAAAAGFGALLLGRLAAEGGAVVWCRRGRDLYGPGLPAFGLDPRRLLLIDAANDKSLCWAMEEALRCRAVAAVLGESAGAPPLAQRRLQLAAETNGSTALLLRPFGSIVTAGAAVTRWQVAAAGAAEEGGRRWRVTLRRCRSGGAGNWLVDGCDETGALSVAADLCHRPAGAATPRADWRRAG